MLYAGVFVFSLRLRAASKRASEIAGHRLTRAVQHRADLAPSAAHAESNHGLCSTGDTRQISRAIPRCSRFLSRAVGPQAVQHCLHQHQGRSASSSAACGGDCVLWWPLWWWPILAMVIELSAV